MDKKAKRRKLVLLVAILILVLVFLFSGLQILESTVFRKGTGTSQVSDRKTIIRDGVEYYPRQDITVILLAGIGEMGPVQYSGSYNNPGEADMVSLMIFDERDETLDILSLNRDTMLDIPVLGISGKPAGTINAQLALAHTYGSGLNDSSENLRKAVSELLYGIKIDYYVSMKMDAIGLINDAVGGVKVMVTDDFSAVDSTITKGEVTLNGQQAINFVRTRGGVGDQLNLSRMERHNAYMTGFMDALGYKMDSDASFVLDIHSMVGDYIVTDCSAKGLSAIADRYGEYRLGDIVTLPGENVKGKQYMEYHLDEDALDEIILEYLYSPKK